MPLCGGARQGGSRARANRLHQSGFRDDKLQRAVVDGLVMLVRARYVDAEGLQARTGDEAYELTQARILFALDRA